ncbi:hypothetical protein [Endozoicomonas elysicola]|uniref:Lipoprotein n=1 Tax=Endozoicomonas elysicola TaxID=305900 RepID=A0A081KCL5_9GAMM|nr:hypothetical protein [Endozoicomonas elysicola]KEI71891.1 hypothetical protein GV64_15150 [Endozoicomonas elysicola]
MKALISIVLFSLLITGCAFKPRNDNYQVIHEGKISGYAYHDYALKLARHDRLTVDINTRQLDVIIISPIEVPLENNQPFTVQSDDEYTLRVLMPRALARRNETHQYQLSITVDRN